MKVLVCHNSYQQPGGEDRSVEDEVALLRSHGHEVIEYHRHNDEIKSCGLIKKAALYFTTAWSKRSYEEIRQLCRRHKPDIAHFHNTLPLISPSAYYGCKEENVPVVQSLRNYRLICPGALLMRDGRICEECLGGDLRPALKHRCYHNSYIQTRAIVRMLRNHRKMGTYENKVNTYIALTNFSKKKFVEGGLQAESITVKPNFLNEYPQAKYGGDYAVFVGRISPEKGPHVLLEAWKRLGFPLKLLGDGPMRKSLERVRPKNVEFLGQVDSGKVIKVLYGARFLAFPVLCYETFGRTIMEAFACGTPVIASRLGTAGELVEDGKTGFLFEPGNAADLAEKAKMLIERPELAEELGRNARAEFEAKYTPEQNYRQLMNIYNATIKKSRS